MIKLGKAELHNADCMELMAQYPDNYFELAIVDPPYGIKRDGQVETFTKNPKHKRKLFVGKGWDSKTPDIDYFYQLERVTKNRIIWGANYYPQYLKSSMGWVFWDKGQDLSMSDGELAYTSFQKALRRIVINRGQLMLEGGTIHPTQKPVKLYEWLLTNYAKQGDKILDTHLGSMSSVIACHNLGFEIVGSELDADYFEAGVERVKKAMSQQRLFE